MHASTRTRTPRRQRWLATALCGAVLSTVGTCRAQTPTATFAPTATAPEVATATPTVVPTTPAPPRVSRRMLAWVLLGTGATLGVSSILTGAFATVRHSDAKSSCSPACSDAELSTGRTLATTSTVLTGAAVVAAAIGVMLYFHPASTGHPSVTTPAVGLDVTPSAVRASTTWRF